MSVLKKVAVSADPPFMRVVPAVVAAGLVAGLLLFDVVNLDPTASAAPGPVTPSTQALPLQDASDDLDEGLLDASRPDESDLGHESPLLPAPAGGTGVMLPQEDHAHLPPLDREPELVTEQIRTSADFEVFGVTWDATDLPATDVVVSVRVREEGRWSQWSVLEAVDGGPDLGSAEASRAAGTAGTEPFTATGADAVQVRVDTVDGTAPAGLQAVVIDAGTSRADGPAPGGALSEAQALPAPGVVTRAQWGADERLRCGPNTRQSTLKAAVVHHTAGTNSYSAGESAAIVRGIYAYHTQQLGWCDIGYNFLVDKYGRVFEGRHGGMDGPVVAAHAGGFNSSTIGVSALGDYNTAGITDALVEQIARVIAWQLAPYYVDPLGATSLTSSGGGTSRYPAGQTVSVPVIMGHRDVGETGCPGNNLYAQLPRIRSLVLGYSANVGLHQPNITATTAAQGSTITAYSGAVNDMSWKLTVRDMCTGVDRLVASGDVQRGAAIGAVWNTATQSSGAGRYVVTLTPFGYGYNGESKSWVVDLTAPTENPAGLGTPPGLSSGRFVPVTPYRVMDTRTEGRALGSASRRDLVVLGRGGVPSTGVSAVALNVTSTCGTGTYASHVTVWPAGGPKPDTSAMNTTVLDTTAAQVVSAPGAGGAVSLYNANGAAGLIVDVVGYYTTSTSGAGFRPLDARRVYDSRTDARGPVSPGQSRRVDLNGVLGGDAGAATAAVVNVTVTYSEGPGWVAAVPAGAASVQTSTVNLVPGADIANRAVVPLAGGAFDLRSGGYPTHVVVDLVGVYTTGSTSAFHPVAPSRVMDSRTGLNTDARAFGAREERSLAVAGLAGVPMGARAVLANVTGDGATGSTHVVAWQSGAARPGTSDLNLRQGRPQANTVVIPIGSDGRIRLYNNTNSTHLIVDVVGYFD